MLGGGLWGSRPAWAGKCGEQWAGMVGGVAQVAVVGAEIENDVPRPGGAGLPGHRPYREHWGLGGILVVPDRFGSADDTREIVEAERRGTPAPVLRLGGYQPSQNRVQLGVALRGEQANTVGNLTKLGRVEEELDAEPLPRLGEAPVRARPVPFPGSAPGP